MKMRQFLAVAVLSAATAITPVHSASAATKAGAATADDQSAVVLKKKVIKKKVAVVNKPFADKQAVAAKKATLFGNTTNVAGERRKAPRLLANGEPCKGFMQCLFGVRRGVATKRDARVQTASVVGAAAGSNVLSRKTTHEVVAWNESKYPVGSLVVRTPERALYYISAKGEAIRYSVGVGREGFQWSGQSKIIGKQEWPTWRPPQVMIEREAAKGHYLPEMMPGGPENPLGARAMYIGGTMFRVHGTNNEASIGGAVSSGCIRMMNADVIDLYDRVKVGAPIFVYQ